VKKLLTLLLSALLWSSALASPPFRLSKGEAEVDYSVDGRARITLSVLNDLGREVILTSYSKP